MRKRIALLAVGLIIVGACSSVVSALPAMGPPRALVGQDQWTVGLGYSYSQMDLEASGKSREDPGSEVWGPWLASKHDIEDLASNMVLGQIGYGVSQNIDVFLSLGISDAQDDMKERVGVYPGEHYTGLDCGFGFAWGFGARATFLQDGDLTWGGVIQVIWENPSDGDVTLREPGADPSILPGDADLDLREIQVAVGPTLQLETFSVYGGPFLHFVEGDIDINVSARDSAAGPADPPNRVELSEDIEQQSEFGFYAGLEGETDDVTSWYVEYRMTSDAWGVGVGAIRRFR